MATTLSGVPSTGDGEDSEELDPVYTPQGGLRSGRTSEHLQDVIVDQRYVIIQELGQGGYGSVYKVDRIKDQQPLALKEIPKSNVKSGEAFQRELGVSRKLGHPNMVKLHEYFSDDVNYYLVMDLCAGGDLFDKIFVGGHSLGTFKPLSHQVTLHYFWQMISGLAYLHHYKICRDVKLENYMLESKSTDNIMLIDFGLARSFRTGLMTSRVGTVDYCAPEILAEKPYNEKCDIWSVGVTAIIMTTGTRPFADASAEKQLGMILLGEIRWDCLGWACPMKLVDIFKTMMKVNPNERLDAKDIGAVRWLRRHVEKKQCCVVM